MPEQADFDDLSKMSICWRCTTNNGLKSDVIRSYLEARSHGQCEDYTERDEPDVQAHLQDPGTAGTDYEIELRTQDEVWTASWKTYCDYDLSIGQHWWYSRETEVRVRCARLGGHQGVQELLVLKVSGGTEWARLVGPVPPPLKNVAILLKNGKVVPLPGQEIAAEDATQDTDPQAPTG